jgi:hypothetical protein
MFIAHVLILLAAFIAPFIGVFVPLCLLRIQPVLGHAINGGTIVSSAFSPCSTKCIAVSFGRREGNSSVSVTSFGYPGRIGADEKWQLRDRQSRTTLTLRVPGHIATALMTGSAAASVDPGVT